MFIGADAETDSLESSVPGVFACGNVNLQQEAR
jgi:thioredoxin reductase